MKLSNQKFESIIEENRKIKKSQLKNPSKQKTKTPRSQKIVLAGEVGRNKNQEEKKSDLTGLIFVILIVILLILFAYIF